MKISLILASAVISLSLAVPAYYFRLSDVDCTNFNYGEIWHTETDMLNRENPRYQQHTAIVTAIVALGIANLDHQLSREGMFIEEGK